MSQSAWTSRLLCVVLVVTVGSGFQHGYHTGVVNIPREIFISWIKLITGTESDDREITLKWSTTVSVFSMGGMVGGALTAFFCKCGPKKGLMWNNLFVLTGTVMLIAAKRTHSFALFIVGRFTVGVNAGLNGGLCQIYLMEIAPLSIRGVVGACYQLMVTVAILVSQLAGWVLGSEDDWALLFVIPLIVAVLQTLTLPFCPESPMYLLMVNEDEEKTQKALSWFRESADVKEEMASIIEEDNLVKKLRTVTLKRMFTNQSLKMSLLMCLALMLGQQFSGINVIIYYSADLFQDAHVHFPSTNFTIILTFLHVLATLLSLWMIYDFERRTLLLFGFLGLTVVTVALMMIMYATSRGIVWWGYISSIFFIAFMVFYSPGIGCIPWFYTAEVFPQPARTLGVSLAIPVNCFANVIVGETFLPLMHAIGYYVYLVFVVLDIFFFFCVYLYMLETSNKSSKEIMEFYH